MVDNDSRETTAWAELPYRKIRETAAADGSILVLPVGSIEQHGHHLPVATDTLLVEAMAELGVDQVADDVPVLVAPTVWSGFSPHHLPFGGTLSLEQDELVTLLCSTAESALENGFDCVLLLNGHGGNKSIIGTATSVIGERHPDVEVLGVTYFDLSKPFIDEIRESDTGGMAHGGEFETSLMLHLHPDLVDTDDAEATYMDEPYERSVQELVVGGPLSVYRPFTDYSESGAIGDPSLANAEKGRRIFEALGDELEELLRKVHERNAGE